MPTPSQVDKIAKEADDLHRQLYPDQYGDPVPPDSEESSDPNAAPTETVPPVEPPPPAEPVSAAPPEGTPPDEGTPAPEPPPGEEPPATPPPTPDPFESKYNVLKGKYDAEVPRLAAEVAALKTQILNRQVPSPPVQQAPPQTPPAPAKTLTIDEIVSGDSTLKEQLASFQEDYPDVANLLVKLTEKAAAITSQKVNDAVNAVNSQVQSVQEFQAVSRTQGFWDVVNRDLPQWETIRDDPGFAVWLAEQDPFAGVARGALLQDALQRLDAPRVLKFYTGYSAGSSAPPQPSPTPNPTPPPTVPGAALVAPPSGTRAAPTPSAPNNIPPITKAYIQQVYTDAARGAYEGREKEFNAIEARINRAVSKGEVVG